MKLLLFSNKDHHNKNGSLQKTTSRHSVKQVCQNADQIPGSRIRLPCA